MGIDRHKIVRHVFTSVFIQNVYSNVFEVAFYESDI